jgi:hypothetical protein
MVQPPCHCCCFHGYFSFLCVTSSATALMMKIKSKARKTTPKKSLSGPNVATPAGSPGGCLPATHKVSQSTCLYMQEAGLDKDVCINHGSPFMQMKDCVCISHRSSVGSPEGESAPPLAWVDETTGSSNIHQVLWWQKPSTSCLLGQYLLAPDSCFGFKTTDVA